MIFLFDENVTEHAVPLLMAMSKAPSQVRYEIRTVIEEFGVGALDRDWIPKAGQWSTKPIVLSGDVRRVTAKAKRQVVYQAGMTWFCLAKGWTNTSWDEYAWKLVKAWPKILSTSKGVHGPKIYQVTVNSTIEELRFSDG